MKKILTLLLLLLSNFAWGQMTTINPDTVCYQQGISIYEVPLTAGLTYNWTIQSPGILLGGQGSNQIQVDWSAASPGLILGAVQVQASNNIGCLSPNSVLNVFVYNLNIVLNPIPDLCETAACVNLVSNIPGGVWSGSGVVGSQFCPSASGAGVTNVLYTVTSAGCTFTNMIQVNVLPIPIISPIFHD